MELELKTSNSADAVIEQAESVTICGHCIRPVRPDAAPRHGPCAKQYILSSALVAHCALAKTSQVSESEESSSSEESDSEESEALSGIECG